MFVFVLGEIRADFLTYLKRSGVYQNLVFTIGQVASLVAQFKLNKIEEGQTVQEYQNFIQQIFIWLMSEVNTVLNGMTNIGKNVCNTVDISQKLLLFYAMEAAEIGNTVLAERYYLQVSITQNLFKYFYLQQYLF